MVLQSPSSKVASDLLSLNRSMSSKVIGLITGHGHLRKHLHRVGILQEDPLCGRCNEQEETAEHLLFDCPAIARERYAIFGSLDRGVPIGVDNTLIPYFPIPECSLEVGNLDVV
ncbi:hypothetical protein J6590_065230 [Homalodisca vitripennis]|nr:hypothetical protein J6590_065230 [Homalodisca vitripennis]